MLETRRHFRLEVLQAVIWPSPAAAPVLLLSALSSHNFLLWLLSLMGTETFREDEGRNGFNIGFFSW